MTPRLRTLDTSASLGEADHDPHHHTGRARFERLLADLPSAKWDVPTQIFEGDVLFIEWNAVSEARQARDGIDTFVFDGDNIRVQTVRYTLEKTG